MCRQIKEDLNADRQTFEATISICRTMISISDTYKEVEIVEHCLNTSVMDRTLEQFNQIGVADSIPVNEALSGIITARKTRVALVMQALGGTADGDILPRDQAEVSCNIATWHNVKCRHSTYGAAGKPGDATDSMGRINLGAGIALTARALNEINKRAGQLVPAR